jgi:hypothetical protein
MQPMLFIGCWSAGRPLPEVGGTHHSGVGLCWIFSGVGSCGRSVAAIIHSESLCWFVLAEKMGMKKPPPLSG